MGIESLLCMLLIVLIFFYRRASICGPVGKLSDDGRVNFRVEAQVQTDDILTHSGVNRWNHHTNAPNGHRKYYDFNEIRHAGRQGECRSDYDCETKL